MTARILDGKATAAALKSELAARVARLAERGAAPGLGTVLVGEDPGSVAYNFSRKGVVEIGKADGVDEDTILMAVLDAGAEEVEDMGDSFEIYSEPSDIVAVRTALTEAGMDYDSAEVQFVAGTKVEVDVEGARKVFRLIDALEDSDDVQNVYTSVDLSPEVAAEFAGDED